MRYLVSAVIMNSLGNVSKTGIATFDMPNDYSLEVDSIDGNYNVLKNEFITHMVSKDSGSLYYWSDPDSVKILAVSPVGGCIVTADHSSSTTDPVNDASGNKSSMADSLNIMGRQKSDSVVDNTTTISHVRWYRWNKKHDRLPDVIVSEDPIDKDDFIGRLMRGVCEVPYTPESGNVVLHYMQFGNIFDISFADKTFNNSALDYECTCNQYIFLESVRDNKDYVSDFAEVRRNTLMNGGDFYGLSEEEYVKQRRVSGDSGDCVLTNVSWVFVNGDFSYEQALFDRIEKDTLLGLLLDEELLEPPRNGRTCLHYELDSCEYNITICDLNLPNERDRYSYDINSHIFVESVRDNLNYVTTYDALLKLKQATGNTITEEEFIKRNRPNEI